jgi:phosphoribosyl-ATP pyrophosphohydrolase/phosphoribosyl-AMP cyclohydrolase/histidinol dehydrogenase
MTKLARLDAAQLLAESATRRDSAAVDPEALQVASKIIDEIAEEGEPALRRWAHQLGDIASSDAPIVLSQQALDDAFESLDEASRSVLERGAERVARFAGLQRDALADVRTEIPGGACGHEVAPVDAAGCYAPGGRFPLPSSVLMTAITARAAGVEQVWVASPRPTAATLAAAKVAKADGVLALGGAQAIAALAYGVAGVPACDVIAGPGNRYVTAAKQLVSGRVRIDMLAGPTELLVLADETANPRLVAADLLGQAEHDVDATPLLVTTDEALVAEVEQQLAVQLEALSTKETAREALARQGAVVVVADIEEGIAVCDHLAPEHLQVCTRNSEAIAQRCRHYGAVFIGEGSAEVIGDYCAGPNHTLPTGKTARYSGGLSVFDFLRVRTWIRIDDRQAAISLYQDAIRIAELEGLAGHAAAARARIKEGT